MPERGALLARMPGSGVPGPVNSNTHYTLLRKNFLTGLDKFTSDIYNNKWLAKSNRIFEHTVSGC